MGIFDMFPFTNFQEKNLDWFVRKMKELESKVNDYTKGFTFADPLAWNINKSYEPLTFVEYNNDIFGSSQAVPAGVAITNNDYWVRFSNYSNLISLINSIDNRVDALEDLVPPSPQEMIVVSDSYGLGRNGADSWVDLFSPYMSDFSHVYNWSNGSMGVNNVGDGGYDAIGFMQAHETDVTDPDSVTVVVIAMGANDIASVSGLAAKFQTLITYIKTTYANASVYIGMIGNILDKNSSVMANYLTCVNGYRNACRRYNKCYYLDGVEYIMHNATLFQADGVHPTSAGAAVIAEGVATALRDGSYTYTATWKLSDGSWNLYQTIDGPVSKFTFADSTATSQAFSNRNYITYKTLTAPLLHVPAAMPIIMMISGFDSNLNKLAMSMKYYQGVIHLSTMQTTAVTLAAGGLYGGTVSFPTLEA